MMQNKDFAVSPVIGVLLMLVVTIIIAAVVSGFAGSIAGDKDKAPQVSLSVDGVIQNISDTNTANYVSDYPTGFTAANGLLFEHKGGDSFALTDVYLQLKSGTTKTTISVSDPLQTTASCLPSTVTAYFMKVGSSDGYIRPGDKFMVYADNCQIDPIGSQISWKKEGAAHGFAAYLNTKCEYKLIDKASNKVMQQGSFVLQ
jgi:archaeal type IV pilus assembly protein PilA